MKRQAGFTLIELVMVIVILGILSAFALPRFADLGSEAREASIKGIYGAIKSASSIAHAQALVENAASTINLEGQAIAMSNKFPTAAGIQDAAQITLSDFGAGSGVAGTVLTLQAAGATTPADCQITYTEATATAPPAIVLTVDDCN